MQSLPVKARDRHLYKRILQQIRGFWLHLGAIGVLTLAFIPLKLLTPVPLAIAVDSVIGDKPLPGWLMPFVPDAWHADDVATLRIAIALLVLVGLAGAAITVLLYLLKSWTDQRMTIDFRSRLFGHAQRLSLQYHDRSGSSDTTYRIQYDAAAVVSLTMGGLLPFLSSLFMLVGMFAVMFALDWQIALLIMGLCPFLMLLVRRWGPVLRRGWKDVKNLESSAMGVIQESISSLRVVKAFGQEDREHDRYVDKASGSMRSYVRVSFSQGLFEVCSSLILLVGSGTVLYLGVSHVQSGLLTVGQLLLVWTYLAQITGPLQALGSQLTAMQSALASAERSFELLDTTPDVLEKPDAKRIDRARGDVAFQGVGFAYKPGEPVLEDVSLSVQAGQTIGLVGQTGAGKSTMMNILIRQQDPVIGRVALDGVDLRDYKLDDLRAQYALVLQESVLFAASIRENICYARPDAGEKQVIDAAKAARAHDFIMKLPEGYDTIVGERGQTLSGGERQRIAIARAFLRDSPVLILDEPTSALDSKTEELILEAMKELMKGRTTFVIAHRLSTIREADKILVLEQGRIVEQGTHDQLIASCGVYHGLVQRQEGKDAITKALVSSQELG